MSREERRTKARWCEHAERYDDMVAEMVELIKDSAKGDALDDEERNLLSVAYKNVVGSRRSSCRVLNAKMQEDMSDKHKSVCTDMKGRVEKELNQLCTDVLKLLNDHLIPNPENDQAKIFFLKMKGDYYRYMIEISEPSSASRDELTGKAEEAYQEAMDIAREKLQSTSPIRLGLVLNYSVFFYEIKNDPTGACTLAKGAFDEAIEGLDSVADSPHYKDSTLIMQLLRDNLTLWTSELEDDDGGD